MNTAQKHGSGTQLRNAFQESAPVHVLVHVSAPATSTASVPRFMNPFSHSFLLHVQAHARRVFVTRFKPVLDAFCAPRAEALRTSKEQICGNTTRKLLTVLLGCGFCGSDKKKNCRCAIHLDKAQRSWVFRVIINTTDNKKRTAVLHNSNQSSVRVRGAERFYT